VRALLLSAMLLGGFVSQDPEPPARDQGPAIAHDRRTDGGTKKKKGDGDEEKEEDYASRKTAGSFATA
jgi:hypothetical protein